MAKPRTPRPRQTSAPASAASEPRRRDRLADQVYGRLLEDIVSGRYEVGDRLPAENDFALSFAVSRPVVREALTRLAADGLVSARQGVGTLIARVPPRQIVKPCRGPASPASCASSRSGSRWKARRRGSRPGGASAAELAQIGRALEAMRKAMEAAEPAFDPDFAFHRAVAVATGNMTFVEILESFAGTISTGMKVALGITRQGTRLRTARVIDEHVRNP